MAELNTPSPFIVPALPENRPSDGPSSSKPQETKEKAAELSIFDTCYQCRKKQVTKPTLYLLQCMHTACRDCLTAKGRDSNEYFCRCARIVPKNHIVLVNRIVCKKGQCQQSLNCKKEIFIYCNQCDLSVCSECLNYHDGHETNPGRPFTSCNKHPKMPAKYMCGCEAMLCHACSTGFQREHQKHQKQTALPPARVIDSCERFNKGICTLQNTTRVTFEMFNTERERLKQHFRMMRIELSKKTMEVVNATLRKMNDCVLAMEMFEQSYLQKYEENEKEYEAKQINMANFKKLCTSTADNNPLQEFLPYITEISSQISTDVSHFTNKIVEAIKAYSQPPEFYFETKPIMDHLHATTKFKFQGQWITPPHRTDPSVNLIDVPIEKLAQHPLTLLAPKRRAGEKHKGGPLGDAVSAKKFREQNDSPRPSEVAGTTINRKTLPVGPKPQPQTSGTASNNNVNVRIYPKLPSGDLRSHLQSDMQHRADPRMNPKVPSVSMNPRYIPPYQKMMQPPAATQATQIRGGFAMTKTTMSPTMNNNHNMNNNYNMHNQHSQHMMPRIPQQQQMQSPRLQMMYNQPHQTTMHNPQLSLQRPPIVPKVKDGPPMMQKALMDIINKTENAVKSPQNTTTNSHHRLSTSSVPDNTRVITPVVNNQGHSSSFPTPPVISSPPVNPPIKLTLRRNPPSTSMSQSPEKEEKRPTKIDDWDDYCFVCNQGCDEISGELVCCEKCPKVYHNVCHIPMINGDVKDLPDDWICTRCKTVLPITEVSEQFTEREKLVCARVLLFCYEKKRGDTVQHSEPFHNPVPRSVKRYYDVITNPICFKEIAPKISNLKYQNIQQFIDDMNLVFKNCCAFNRKGTAVELSCRVVFDLYSKAVKEYLRPYHSKIWLYQNSPKLQ